MLSDEEKKAIERLKNIAIYMGDNYTFSQQGIRNLRENLRIVLPAIEKQSKEIEELKASHITTNNKVTNTEKAKIFDVIENSIDTYIEKSKPYWEQIMTKDEMTIDEALTIIDDMYQDRYKIMSQKTEKETIVDLSKMDCIKFTNLEWASVRALREVQSLNHKLEKWEDKIKSKIEELTNEVMEKELIIDGMKEDRRIAVEEIQEQYYVSKDKIKAIIEELQEDIKYSANPLSIDNSKFGIKVLQSLLEKE